MATKRGGKRRLNTHGMNLNEVLEALGMHKVKSRYQYRFDIHNADGSLFLANATAHDTWSALSRKGRIKSLGKQGS